MKSASGPLGTPGPGDADAGSQSNSMAAITRGTIFQFKRPASSADWTT